MIEKRRIHENWFIQACSDLEDAKIYPDALPGGIPSLVYGMQDAMTAINIAEKALGFISNKIGIKCPD